MAKEWQERATRVRVYSDMTGRDFLIALRDEGLFGGKDGGDYGVRDFAHIMGVTPKTVEGWIHEGRKIPLHAIAYVQLAGELRAALAAQPAPPTAPKVEPTAPPRETDRAATLLPRQPLPPHLRTPE